MFNLLMFGVDWQSGRVLVPAARMLEYTDTHISEKFKDDKGQFLLDSLASLPCVFCGEGTGEESVFVGQINRARASGSNVSLEISVDAEVPALQNRVLYTNRSQLDMPHDFEFSRNHWAVKDVDLYRFVLRTVCPHRQRPKVFQISEHEQIELELASAMMPFDIAFNSVYVSIKEAAENAGLRCRRADDIWENPSIIQDVVSLVDRSRIVVCDCTGRNPNVFYETGIAHTLGREVIIITQNEHDIPFDLRHLRYIKYLNNVEGRAALTGALQSRMQTLLGH